MKPFSLERTILLFFFSFSITDFLRAWIFHSGTELMISLFLIFSFLLFSFLSSHKQSFFNFGRFLKESPLTFPVILGILVGGRILQKSMEIKIWTIFPAFLSGVVIFALTSFILYKNDTSS